MESGLRTIMNTFIRKSALATDKSLFEVDHNDETLHLARNRIYFGAKFEALVAKKGHLVPKDALMKVQDNCLRFLCILCDQIKSRINYQDSLLHQLECVDPLRATSGDIESIVPLIVRFEDTFSRDIEVVNSEFRRLYAEVGLMDEFKAFTERNPIQSKKRKRKTPRKAAKTSASASALQISDDEGTQQVSNILTKREILI